MSQPTKPRAKVRKPRRPADWRYRPTGPIAASIDGACIFVDGPLYPSEARRLAAWLLKAADYLDAKEKP